VIRVLVVDDEGQILRALRVILRDAGFEAIPASTVAEALDAAAVRPPEAAIVDLLLPDGDGIEVVAGLREWSQMPVLLLSAVDDEDAKVRALQAGADDYVVKPFAPRELVARLERALRRVASGDDPVIELGGLRVDLAARVVSRDGAEVHLTPLEYGLLRELVRNRGRLLTHTHLLHAVWGVAYAHDTAVLRRHMSNLRAKVDPAGGLIRTEPGVGYRLG
jgi:two-component system KDP operon response regulator KdpE